MSAAASAAPVPVAEIVRSGFVEGHHYGSLVALGQDGEVDWSVGAVAVPVLPRSCNKPLQALGMVRLGLDLPPELLALACASHSGEDFHIEGARRILGSAGLGESALQTPPDWPLDDEARLRLIRDGGEKSRIHMNCSGKHSAMLATCVVNGWDTASYLDPQHPLQQVILETFAEMTGERVEQVAVDGCGAPLLSTSLIGLARAFRRLALGLDGNDKPDERSQRITDAIRQHPASVSGTTRDERELLTAIPGSIGKAGAESCYAVALADGRAFALKTDDGAARVRPVLMAEMLRRAGVPEEDGVDADAVRRTGVVELLGGGRPVGEIRASF
ncbi:asparaginase [Nocardioides panaciterrulae]|uniref:L-asparaginase II n=1 Tax=Nocardioides panaciterrulae TaxID=661492 RepID=A0A7Y9E3E7_9ACTN|nr:asparaginase [Nocardioides panaciterrulae]NYD40498.1 L-asparaginase II [Nocardioides panaciterrulae]